MDISTASGALIISLLRLLHIVAGLIWVGAALLMSFYIEPMAGSPGAEGGRFLRALYSKTHFPRLIPLSALVATIAGLLLYGLLAYHEAMSSAMGVILTLGALFGLLLGATAGLWPFQTMNGVYFAPTGAQIVTAGLALAGGFGFTSFLGSGRRRA